MSKTLEELAEELAEGLAEELAEEFATDWHKDCDYPEVLLKSAKAASKTVFRAGYQAATPQWISVKERLPERSQKVLALGEDQTVLLLKLRETYDKDLFGNWEYVSGFDQDVNGCLVIDVTHWMPLPEPPKDAKE